MLVCNLPAVLPVARLSAETLVPGANGVCGWGFGDPTRFPRDWRATVNDLLVENFFGRIAALGHQNGLAISYETAPGDVFPGDILEYYKYADVPMCEFWQTRTEAFVGSFDFKPVKPCVSAARMMEEYCLPLADANQGTFSPAVSRRGEAALRADATGPFNRYGRLMLPVLEDAAPKFAYAQGSVDLARTAIALERYRLARGAVPESLDALTPQCIAKVPHDAISGQALKYRRESDGLFLLYSVGWNETDDGGVAGLNQDGSVDTRSGDWVWRYPAKGE